MQIAAGYLYRKNCRRIVTIHRDHHNCRYSQRIQYQERALCQPQSNSRVGAPSLWFPGASACGLVGPIASPIPSGLL